MHHLIFCFFVIILVLNITVHVGLVCGNKMILQRFSHCVSGHSPKYAFICVSAFLVWDVLLMQ